MRKRDAKAFSLIEVTLALGIIAFALVILLALLPVGLNSSQNSSQESAATNILSAFVADIRNIPKSQTDTPVFKIPVWQDAGTKNGRINLDVDGNLISDSSKAQYALIWTIQPESSSQKNPLFVHLRVEWPANAPQPSSSVETLVALARQNR